MLEKPGLTQNQVEIWLVNIPEHINRSVWYETLLNDEEREKADRFYFAKDRLRYVITHGILRRLISQYVAIPPKELVFLKNPFGKPYISPVINTQKIQFNISHSKEGIIIAISKGNELGVDLEFARDTIPILEIAQRFFSPYEYQVLLATPASFRLLSFYRCWTRKEAFIKAKGKGLSIPLDSFDVTVSPDQPPQLIRSSLDPSDLEKWKLREIDTWPNYLATICIEGKDHQFVIKHWQ
jgi:4'-phosphopantetheinyl transferase